MLVTTIWTRRWSPVLCLIFYFTTVSWLVPWDTALANPSAAANISPDIKAVDGDLSNDELHKLLSLLAGTDTKENPPLSILLAKPPTTVQTTTTTPSTTIATTTKTTTTTTPAPKTTTTARNIRRFTRATTAHTTSTTTTTEKTQEVIVPATASSESKQNLRALVSPPQNDLVQQLSLLNSLLGSVGGGNGNANQGLGGLGALGGLGGFGGLGGLGGLGALGAPQNGFDASAASEAAAALFGVAPAALAIPTTTTTTTTTTTPRPTTTTIKPVGTLDDTSAALQSLALLNVLLGNAGDTKSANNSAAAALLGLGTASSSPAVRQTQSPSSAQKEQEAAVQLTNLLLQSASAGNPQLQNFKNAPTNNMDTAASNQLSGLLGILGTLGTLNGQQQQLPQQQLSQGLFNLGQQNQQPQGNFLSNIFQQQQPQQQQPQQTNLLTSLFGGVTTTPAPSIPGFGLLSSMVGLGSTLISTVTNTLGGSRGDGRPRVRGKGVDTRLGLGYRFGDNADAQVMWEIGPQIFTQPLKGDESNSIPSKRNAGSTSLLESASTRVLEMFQPNYAQNKHPNPPWRRVDSTEDTVVSKESLSSVAASLPHQSLKTLKALLEMKKRQERTTPATTPASQRLSSLFSWYSSTTPAPIKKIYLPAQEVFAPPAPSVATSKIGSLFSWFSKAQTTAAPIHIPSTQVTPPVSTLDKLVSWYMGGETSLPSTTEQPPLDISSIFFPPEGPKPIPDMWNIEPSNFLKRSSMPPPSPTSQNYYAKPHINPRNNKHSSLTTYEKYLLGLLEDDEINKSQDIDTVPTMSPKNMNHGLNYNNNRRSHSLPHNSNVRNANGYPGWGHQATQQRRNSVNGMNSQKKNPFSQANLNGPYFRQHGQNGNHAKQNRNKQANGNHALYNQNNGNHAVHNQNNGNHAMHNQNNVNHEMHNQNNVNHAMHNQNNVNHAMHNQNRQAGSHFNFASHNKIVTMTGANSPPPPPPRKRRPPGYMRPQNIVNSGIRRRFDPNRQQFSNRQTGSFFNNFNPFAAFSRFTSKKKNNPPNNWNSNNNNGNNNNFQNNGNNNDFQNNVNNNFQNFGNNNYQNNGNIHHQNNGNNNYQNNENNNNNFQNNGNNDHNFQNNGNNDHNFQNNGNQNDYNSHNKNRDNLDEHSKSDTYINLDQTGYGSTGMSNIDTVPTDSYNPYGNEYGNGYGTSGKSHNSNSDNNYNMDNNNNHNNDKHQDHNAAASNIHSTKTPYYNPHQNFIPESDDSFDRRNAVVTNPKLRAAELEKIYGEPKEKNDTKAELGRNDRKGDEEDDTPDTPTQKLMGLLKTVLNTKIKPRLHNKEKNIASISLTTPKPMLPRNKRPPGARTQTKLKLTNGRPEIVLVPTPPQEIRPIVHVGQDMSFEEIQEHYSIKESKTTTTRKPKVKSKKDNKAKKGNSNKNTELIVSDDDIELSEEDEDSKEVFIDIDSGEVSVLKPVASLTSFEPEKEDSPEEEEEEEIQDVQDEETKRKQEIFEGIQKELHSSYEKMRKAQLKADAKQKRKEELAAKGMDESLDMVSKYFDLIEESEKQDEEKSRPQNPPPHSNLHYANNGRGNPNLRRPTGYNSNNSYSKLRQHKKRRRRDIANNNVEKFSKSPSYFQSLIIKKTTK